MIAYVIIKFAIPLLNGTFAKVPAAKEYTAADVSEVVDNFVDDDALRYGGTQLLSNEKKAYDAILLGVLAHGERITIEKYGLDLEALQKVFSTVRNDYPEIFWIDNNCKVYTAGDIITDCLPNYLYDEELTEKMIANIEMVRDTLLAGMTAQTDYEKVMYMFKYLIMSTDYDSDSYQKSINDEETEETEYASNIYGTLLKNKAICEGYSKTFQYLMISIGVDCIYVTGSSQGQGHAWNYIKLENSWYAVDATWSDPANSEIITYAYCMITEDEMAQDHRVEMSYPIPACIGTKYNYYSYNGYELSAYSEKDVSNMFLKAYATGTGVAEIHCANQIVFDDFVNAIENQEIYGCFDKISDVYGVNITSLNYVKLDPVLVLHFEF